MRILLDECVHAGIRKAFAGHSVNTVPQAGWSGIKNGKLLTLIAGSYDVFLTIDQNIRHQQNLADLPSLFFSSLFRTIRWNPICRYSTPCYAPSRRQGTVTSLSFRSVDSSPRAWISPEDATQRGKRKEKREFFSPAIFLIFPSVFHPISVVPKRFSGSAQEE